jgi:hypothetical protein
MAVKLQIINLLLSFWCSDSRFGQEELIFDMLFRNMLSVVLLRDYYFLGCMEKKGKNLIKWGIHHILLGCGYNAKSSWLIQE